MSEETVLVTEIFPAGGADVRSSITMHIHVTLIVRKLKIIFSTNITHIFRFIAVFQYLMSAQRVPVVKYHGTYFTDQLDIFMDTFLVLAKIIHCSILFSTMLTFHFLLLVNVFLVSTEVPR